MNVEIEKMLNHILVLEGDGAVKFENFPLDSIKAHLMDLFGFQNDKKISPSLSYLLGRNFIVLINSKSKIYKIDFKAIRLFLGVKNG